MLSARAARANAFSSASALSWSCMIARASASVPRCFFLVCGAASAAAPGGSCAGAAPLEAEGPASAEAHGLDLLTSACPGSSGPGQCMDAVGKEHPSTPVAGCNTSLEPVSVKALIGTRGPPEVDGVIA